MSNAQLAAEYGLRIAQLLEQANRLNLPERQQIMGVVLRYRQDLDHLTIGQLPFLDILRPLLRQLNTLVAHPASTQPPR